MEMGYNFFTPADDFDEYEGAFTASQQPPVTQNHMFSNCGPSPLMAVGPSYEMPLEPFYCPMTGVTPPHIWPSTPRESSVHELRSSPGLGTATSPVIPTEVSTRKKRVTKRRILSDKERQDIYTYHKENKAATHLEIAAIFKVERSTVTKLINRADKPLAISKPSVEEIISKTERALKTWVIKHQSVGLPMDDGQIIAKARIFASAYGRHEVTQIFETQEWLQRFKSENLLDLTPKAPMSSESQTSSNFPISAIPISKGESVNKQFGERPTVAAENVAEYSASLIELDDTSGLNAQAGEAIKAKGALEIVKMFIRRQALVLNAAESSLIGNWQKVLEEQTRHSDNTGPFRGN